MHDGVKDRVPGLFSSNRSTGDLKSQLDSVIDQILDQEHLQPMGMRFAMCNVNVNDQRQTTRDSNGSAVVSCDQNGKNDQNGKSVLTGLTIGRNVNANKMPMTIQRKQNGPRLVNA